MVDALDEAYAQRGAPEFIRCDNGPELVAMAIRDWCRFMGTGTAYIEPGSPWENPYVESFNGKLRDELFAREVFDSVMEARILFDDWGDVYNRHRPHSALGYLAPAVFAAAWNSRKSGSDQIPSANAATPGGCITIPEPYIEGGPGNGVRSTRPSGVKPLPLRPPILAEPESASRRGRGPEPGRLEGVRQFVWPPTRRQPTPTHSSFAAGSLSTSWRA